MDDLLVRWRRMVLVRCCCRLVWCWRTHNHCCCCCCHHHRVRLHCCRYGLFLPWSCWNDLLLTLAWFFLTVNARLHSSFERQRAPLNCLRWTRMSVVERGTGTGARQHGFFPARCRGFCSLGWSRVLGRGGAKSIAIHTTINQKSAEEIAAAAAATTTTTTYQPLNNQQQMHLGNNTTPTASSSAAEYKG